MKEGNTTAYNPYDHCPPGHYYSPIPDVEVIRINERRIFTDTIDTLPGIELCPQQQIELLNEIKKYYNELPFKDQKSVEMRYFYQNNFYTYGDAVVLFCMIRHFKPKRVIEIGSGFSSCIFLDTNEIFFEKSISFTFIEPYPDRLFSLIKKEDIDQIELIQKPLQEIDIGIFSSLSENDILFIDSSHVSKINSDVNYIFFKILPTINSGVHIHFHDIFYPFEYLKEWVYEGRFWNEAYLLNAFLQYNDKFQIELFSSYLYKKYCKQFLEAMPMASKISETAVPESISAMWLRKV